SLISIKLPENVDRICILSFAECTNLASITIPSSVTDISFNAFENCGALKDVYYSGTKEQWEFIDIEGNDYLKKATIHYNQGNGGSEFAPARDHVGMEPEKC
ncbi:MAG: leucine-rich repeat protein, partial [Erysipelotrichaceae bacterium]|nr:leucine-rich repeat protein [Erysipelotrichaceae bacterium]